MNEPIRDDSSARWKIDRAKRSNGHDRHQAANERRCQGSPGASSSHSGRALEQRHADVRQADARGQRGGEVRGRDVPVRDIDPLDGKEEDECGHPRTQGDKPRDHIPSTPGHEDSQSDEREQNEGRLGRVVAGDEAERSRDADQRRPRGAENRDLLGVERVSGQKPIMGGLNRKRQQPEEDRNASPERQCRESAPVCDQRPDDDQATASAMPAQAKWGLTDVTMRPAIAQHRSAHETA